MESKRKLYLFVRLYATCLRSKVHQAPHSRNMANGLIEPATSVRDKDANHGAEHVSPGNDALE
jgi:hypothetical protein